MTKNPKTKLGKWNKTEHERFMKAIQKYGKNWSLIQKAVPLRTLAQVRSHAQKLFLAMNKEELKNFQHDLNLRFESFCQLQKQNEARISKSTQNSIPSTETFTFGITNDAANKSSFEKNDSEQMENNVKLNKLESCQNSSTGSNISNQNTNKLNIQIVQNLPFHKQYAKQQNFELQNQNFCFIPYYNSSQLQPYLYNQAYFLWLPC